MTENHQEVIEKRYHELSPNFAHWEKIKDLITV